LQERKKIIRSIGAGDELENVGAGAPCALKLLQQNGVARRARKIVNGTDALDFSAPRFLPDGAEFTERAQFHVDECGARQKLPQPIVAPESKFVTAAFGGVTGGDDERAAQSQNIRWVDVGQTIQPQLEQIRRPSDARGGSQFTLRSNDADHRWIFDHNPRPHIL